MFILVKSARATQRPLLGYWALHRWRLLIVAAVSWVLPSLVYAADAEPTSSRIAIPASAPVEPSISTPKPQHPVQTEHAPALDAGVCAPDGVALGGYDLVSYHKADAPQVGDKAIFAEHRELIYRFASAQNRSAFLVDPDKYLPNYRGWCSTNLSMGRLACPDYTNYKLENGKLLFFERVGFTNGLDVWNSDPVLHKRQADQNFVLLSAP